MEAIARDKKHSFRVDVCKIKRRFSLLEPSFSKEDDSKFVPRTNPQIQMQGIAHDKLSFREYVCVDNPTYSVHVQKAIKRNAPINPIPTEELEFSEKDSAFYSAVIRQVQKYRRCPGLQSRAYPPEGICLICSLDEHTSWECPYAVEVPSKNAIVGSGSDIVCKLCDGEFSGGGGHCCNQGSGRAMLKFCSYCRIFGEHCIKQCPHHLLDPRLQ